MTRGQRTMAAVAGGLLAVAALVWVMLLPMRQAPFTVAEHELVRGADGTAIAGRLRNRGAAARSVIVEAYLYDGENRYLGTARVALAAVPEDATVEFGIPVDPRVADHVGRYSLYAGTTPNPFAPDR